MATGFVEIDQVLSYDPWGDMPDTSMAVQFTFTLIGPDIPNKRLDTNIQVRVDLGDTLQIVQSKIRDAARNTAANSGIALATQDLVIPAYQKG